MHITASEDAVEQVRAQALYDLRQDRPSPKNVLWVCSPNREWVLRYPTVPPALPEGAVHSLKLVLLLSGTSASGR